MKNTEQTIKNDRYQNGLYLDNNPTWHEEDSSWKAEKILNMLARNNLNPKSIAEVGCGAGEILRCMAADNQNADFYGYEISSQAFEMCKQKENNNLHFFHSDLLNEQLQEKYDLLMAIDVFEHVEDYIGFLRNLRKNGECKIFHIPLDLSVQALLRVSPIVNFSRGKYGHLHHFSKEIALSTLEYAGYEILDWSYTPGSLELGNLGVKTKLLKLPRRIMFKINQDFAVRLLGGFSLLVLAR